LTGSRNVSGVQAMSDVRPRVRLEEELDGDHIEHQR